MLTAAALFNGGFGVFHVLFWRIFGWPRTLQSSGPVNAGITQVLNLCLTFVFFAMAIGLGLSARNEAHLPATEPLLATAAAFWLFRAALQPVYFGLKHPASIILFAIFLAGAAIHAAAFVFRAGL